jgi:hypothetical protein
VTTRVRETFGVSSNGWSQLGPGNTDNTPSGKGAREGSPKIAALWAISTLLSSASTREASLPTLSTTTGDPEVDRVVFTWDTAFLRLREQTGLPRRAQIQLFESGRIVFGYDGVLTSQAVDDYGDG